MIDYDEWVREFNDEIEDYMIKSSPDSGESLFTPFIWLCIALLITMCGVCILSYGLSLER
jgi:hypothetical protein